MQPVSRFVRGAHDLRLHLLEWSGDGVPLLLLHGFGNDAHIWDDFAPSVAPHYRTLALDHRGHGDSAWDPERRYDHDAMLEDVERVTEDLGISRLVLVGLVIVDVGPEVDARGKLRIRMDVEAQPAPVFDSSAEYARALSLAYPAATPAALARMAQHGLRRRDDGRYELKMDPALRGAFSDRESPERAEERELALAQASWDALAKVPCPALVVRGAASDILSPDVADRMVDEVLPRGRLAIVARAGHSVMTDNPEGFRQAVCDFVLG
jgi:pimeloyl-ACP methyl ester carboxylesterase